MPQVLRDRMEIIEPLIRTGDVLDLGCVDARPQRHGSAERIERKPNSLHKRITQINPAALGVDFDAEGVKVLQSMGLNVVQGDVETLDLGRQFDTIIAGELIEHLENPGRFLRNMLRHLKPAGKLVISTPNPFYAAQTWKIWRYGQPAVHEDHMNWQDPTTLRQLLMRTGYQVESLYWIQPHPALLKSWKRLLRPWFSHTFLMVATPRG